MKKEKDKAGKLSIDDIKKLLNKDAGGTVAYTTDDKDSPNNIPYWIPTGSRILDGIICKGKMAGIPGGRVTEIAALEGVGKSFLAQVIAGNAQKLGLKVIYFDSESALDPAFAEALGVNNKEMIYVQPRSLESSFAKIEEVMTCSTDRWLFIVDSYANIPTEGAIEGSFNPQDAMAQGARIGTRAMQKLVVPLAEHQSTLLVLNQLKTNIAKTPFEAMLVPYFTAGGRALLYAYSLRIWLTKPKAKASFIVDDKGYKIGSEVKVKLEKSRFGTEGRVGSFKLLWGTEECGIQDEESWWSVVKNSPKVSKNGHRFCLEGVEGSFFEKDWVEFIKDEKAHKKAVELLDEMLIGNFEKRIGNADNFYHLEGEPREEELLEQSE